MNKIDYSERDSAGKEVFYVLLKKRKGISLNMFDNYWKDVHGPVCARLPGQHQYWQFHIAHNEGGIWPKLDGITYDTSEDEQFDGIAELTFLSESDRQEWFDAASILMSDEHNLFSKAVGYTTLNNDSKTHIDKIENGSPNGGLEIVKLHVMLAKADSVSVEDFQKYLTNSFTSAVISSSLIHKFRLHLLEEHDNSEELPTAPGVTHYEALEKQFQAAFEIAFQSRLDMEEFFASEEYGRTLKEQVKYIKQISVFPERDVYTFVYDDEMTLAGQRSSAVASLIENIGAANQLQPSILDLMVGQTI